VKLKREVSNVNRSTENSVIKVTFQRLEERGSISGRVMNVCLHHQVRPDTRDFRRYSLQKNKPAGIITFAVKRPEFEDEELPIASAYNKTVTYVHFRYMTYIKLYLDTEILHQLLNS
jgi:hypothetical protein